LSFSAIASFAKALSDHVRLAPHIAKGFVEVPEPWPDKTPKHLFLLE
jgi:hypothetical protein